MSVRSSLFIRSSRFIILLCILTAAVVWGPGAVPGALAEEATVQIYLPHVQRSRVLPALPHTELVSVALNGASGTEFSSHPALSADGRFVAFQSPSSDLVAGDTNSQLDIFVRDLMTQQTERVSVAADGAEKAGIEYDVRYRTDISGDGRYVVFASSATNLVADDTNGRIDLFVRDRSAQNTVRLAVLSAGADGQQSNGDAYAPSISADGQWIAFVSTASNLTATPPDGSRSVYLHHTGTGETRLIASDSPAIDFGLRPSLSADGQFVAFVSENSTLVPGDTNGQADVFVYAVATQQIERVSHQLDGSQRTYPAKAAAISGDGRFVVYLAPALELGAGDSIFLYDRQSKATTWVSQPPAGTSPSLSMTAADPAITDDGSVVAFAFNAALVADDTNGSMDIYLYTRQTGSVERASLSSAGEQADLGAVHSTLSADGGEVAFSSSATNLVQGDTNQNTDVFVRLRSK